MSLQQTPSGERLHIGFFGQRNVGKSSLVNAITSQQMSVVSDTKGTTTDPVRKAMELLPLGPVLIIDTPGFDDSGALGLLRVQKTRDILRETDLAVLVVDATMGLSPSDHELIRLFQEQNTPFISVFNKVDLLPSPLTSHNSHEISVSAVTGYHIQECKELIARLVPKEEARKLLEDLISPGDVVILVTPIDAAAPKGRLILPQVQATRAILDAHGIALTVQANELQQALKSLCKAPELVITDSQVFDYVSQIVLPKIPLTSFSILFARYKGFLNCAVEGVHALDQLPTGARILVAEGCSHHRQCGDIGTTKLPRWIQTHTGKDFQFEFCSGHHFPEDLGSYDFVLHCGGCMLNKKALISRMQLAQAQGIPFTNYGVLIAHMNNILNRCLLNGRFVDACQAKILDNMHKMQ